MNTKASLTDRLYNLAYSGPRPMSVDDIKAMGDHAFGKVVEDLEQAIRSERQSIEREKDGYRTDIRNLLENTSRRAAEAQYETVPADWISTYKGNHHGGPGNVPKTLLIEDQRNIGERQLQESQNENVARHESSIRKLELQLSEAKKLRDEAMLQATAETSSLVNENNLAQPDAMAEPLDTVPTPTSGIGAYMRRGWKALQDAMRTR